MQVTPKGYKAGGKVSPTKKAGPKAARSPSKQQRKMGAGARDKKKTAIDKINKTKAIYSSLKESANSNNPMRTDRVFRTGKVNYRNPESAIEFYGDKGSKKGLAEKAMNRRIKFLRNNMKKGGSALKPVQPNQKGLSKLPTEVRNKMGYMQDGGKVKDKPGKNMVLGKTFHPITENAMVNNIVKNFSGNKKFASVNDLQDRHKEIKEKFFNKGVKPSEIQKLDKEFKSRLVKAKSRANKAIANRPGMKEYRKKQQKAKAIDTGSEN
jgi:uncharacterized protein YlbG (UPF0298 family)